MIVLNKLIGKLRSHRKRHTVALPVEFLNIIGTMHPGEFASLNIDGRRFAIMESDDFEHIAQLAGLRVV